MRERVLLLFLIAACLLALLVAYRQHEAVQDSLRDVEQLTAGNRSKTSQLQAAIEKNVELSEQLTQLAEESSQNRRAASDAHRAKRKLEERVAKLDAALMEKGAGEAELEQKTEALEQQIVSLEAAIKGLVSGLDEERAASSKRLEELSTLVAGDSTALKELDKRLASLPERVDELSSLLKETAATSEATEEPVLEELARLNARLDEHKVSLRGLSRKIEILARMLAVGTGAPEAGGRPPPKIEGTVAAVDPARNEVALSGDLGGLQPGHSVWISRDGIVVARADVFRVDSTTGLAAARITWTLPDAPLRDGDRVTTDPPSTEAQGPAPPDGGAESSEKDSGESDGKREEESAAGGEGPVFPRAGDPIGPASRPRPPPPPPRPEDDR